MKKGLFDDVNLQWFAEEGDPAGGDPKPGGDPTFLPFMAQMPDEYKERQDINEMGSFGGIVKNYDEVVAERDQLKTATEGIEKPPEKAEDYEFDQPELPEGLEYDKEFEAFYRDVFLKAHLTQEQAKTIYAAYNEHMVAGVAKTKEELEKAVEAQKKAWGPDYDKNCELSLRARNTFWPVKEGKVDPFLQLADAPKIGNHPDFIDGIMRAGKMIGEDSLAESSGARATPDRSEADQKLADRYDKSPELRPENQSKTSRPPGDSISLEAAKEKWPNSPELWPEQ